MSDLFDILSGGQLLSDVMIPPGQNTWVGLVQPCCLGRRFVEAALQLRHCKHPVGFVKSAHRQQPGPAVPDLHAMPVHKRAGLRGSGLMYHTLQSTAEQPAHASRSWQVGVLEGDLGAKSARQTMWCTGSRLPWRRCTTAPAGDLLSPGNQVKQPGVCSSLVPAMQVELGCGDTCPFLAVAHCCRRHGFGLQPEHGKEQRQV